MVKINAGKRAVREHKADALIRAGCDCWQCGFKRSPGGSVCGACRMKGLGVNRWFLALAVLLLVVPDDKVGVSCDFPQDTLLLNAFFQPCRVCTRCFLS